MAYTNFRQEIWTGGVLAQVRKNLVAQSIVNSSYSGDIAKKGDTVHIRGVDALSVGTNLASFTYNQASPTDTTLVVDQASVVPFQVPEEDAMTTDLDIVSIYTTEAGRVMAEAADGYVLSLIDSTSFDSTAVSLDLTAASPDPYQALVNLSKALNKASAPRAGRYVIVSAEMEAALLTDSRFLRSTPMGDQVMLTGEIGKAAGFSVLSSENFKSVTTTGTVQKLFAGVAGAIGYADIVLPVRANEAQGARAVNVDAAHIYGAKVLRPSFLVRLDVTVA